MKETKKLEFKESITNTFLKTVSAFSNYDGGKVIFGMRDDGTVAGINNPAEACLDIENKINESISPQPDYDLQVQPDDTVILIVHKGKNKPYFYKSKAYKRNDTSTIEVDFTELRHLILQGANKNFEELPAANQKLTFCALEEKLKKIAEINKVDENILKTLDLYSDEEGFNIAAELLADENSFCGIDIGKFGENISIIQKRKTLEHVSVLNLYEQANNFFDDFYKYEKVEGDTRKVITTIPKEAFREAVANALIHRTWDTETHIRILMFDNKIEIYSPGGLPDGISETDYLNGNFSNLRNPILAHVFYRLRMVEIFGTGIRRINESYEKSISKPVFELSENCIKITLPLLKLKTEFSSEQQEIISLLSKTEGKSISTLSEKLDFGKTKIRLTLVQLEGQNIVKVTGKGKSTKYLLK